MGVKAEEIDRDSLVVKEGMRFHARSPVRFLRGSVPKPCNDLTPERETSAGTVSLRPCEMWGGAVLDKTYSPQGRADGGRTQPEVVGTFVAFP